MTYDQETVAAEFSRLGCLTAIECAQARKQASFKDTKDRITEGEGLLWHLGRALKKAHSQLAGPRPQPPESPGYCPTHPDWHLALLMAGSYKSLWAILTVVEQVFTQEVLDLLTVNSEPIVDGRRHVPCYASLFRELGWELLDVLSQHSLHPSVSPLIDVPESKQAEWIVFDDLTEMLFDPEAMTSLRAALRKVLCANAECSVPHRESHAPAGPGIHSWMRSRSR